MKLLSLFDGSGGFPLAGALCGITPIAASEIEPYPIAVTKSRFPNMKHLGDISKINGAEIEPVDIITFGSPCQDMSVAGKRAGLKHEDNGDDETTRSGLFMEAVRIIKEMRGATNGKYPRFAVWENVPGAFSSNKGEDFRLVLEELIKTVEPNAIMPEVPKKGWAYADSYVGDGWSIAYRVFDAQYIRTAQRRRRIYLVLDLGGQCARQILFERQSLRRYLTESGTQRKGTPTDAERSIGADDREGKCISFHLTQDVITSEKHTPCISSGNPISGQASVGVCIGVDIYNTTLTGDRVCSLTAEGYTSTGTCPKVMLLDDQGGQQISVRTDGKVPILRAEAHGKVPCAVTLEPGIAAREGGHVYEGVSGTLRANAGDNQMSVAYSIENHPNDSRVKIDDEGKVQALTSRMGTGGGNVPMVMEEKPVICLQGNGIDRADTAGCNGRGWNDKSCYTLNTIDRPAVAYEQPIAIDRAFFNQGENALYEPQTYEDGTNTTLVAKGPSAVCVADHPTQKVDSEGKAFTLLSRDYKCPHCVVDITKPTYIVRRLTPTECARLQGFPDKWGHIDHKDDFTNEEYEFWLNVRNTHAEINGKQVKDYTKKQMLTWYNKLHTDSAEYKLWGNGIALPCALYVMQGIADVINK